MSSESLPDEVAAPPLLHEGSLDERALLHALRYRRERLRELHVRCTYFGERLPGWVYDPSRRAQQRVLELVPFLGELVVFLRELQQVESAGFPPEFAAIATLPAAPSPHAVFSLFLELAWIFRELDRAIHASDHGEDPPDRPWQALVTILGVHRE